MKRHYEYDRLGEQTQARCGNYFDRERATPDRDAVTCGLCLRFIKIDEQKESK